MHFRILHIDDDPDEAITLREWLGDIPGFSFELESVTGTAEAEQLLGSGQYDMLIADTRLAGHDRYRSGSSFFAYLIDLGDIRPKILLSGAPPDLLHDRTQSLIANGHMAFIPKDALSASVLEPVMRHFSQSMATSESREKLHTFFKPVLPFSGFTEAANNLTKRLQSLFGFRLAMMTRVSGDDWIVLNAHDSGYGVKAGDVYHWSDSFCSRMVAGHGPMYSANVANVPAYQEAPVGEAMEIACYLGIPICRADGSLFGTVCAIDPAPRAEAIEADLPEILYECKLLGTILDGELQREELKRELEKAVAESKSDELTALYNRRGWEDLLESEEQRCKRYGHPAGVLMIDVDGLKELNDVQGHEAGDQLLKQAAQVIRQSLRREDIAARIGGDEFAVLAVEATADAAGELVRRMQKLMLDAGVELSIGYAQREPAGTLAASLQVADERMYAEKSRRKAGAP